MLDFIELLENFDNSRYDPHTLYDAGDDITARVFLALPLDTIRRVADHFKKKAASYYDLGPHVVRAVAELQQIFEVRIEELEATGEIVRDAEADLEDIKNWCRLGRGLLHREDDQAGFTMSLSEAELTELRGLTERDFSAEGLTKRTLESGYILTINWPALTWMLSKLDENKSAASGGTQ